MQALDIREDKVSILLDGDDTRAWATGQLDNGAWPCSVLSGEEFCATFDSNGLLDFASTCEEDDVPGDELSAICADFLKGHLPETHPAYAVAVGQFQDEQDDE